MTCLDEVKLAMSQAELSFLFTRISLIYPPLLLLKLKTLTSGKSCVTNVFQSLVLIRSRNSLSKSMAVSMTLNSLSYCSAIFGRQRSTVMRFFCLIRSYFLISYSLGNFAEPVGLFQTRDLNTWFIKYA